MDLVWALRIAFPLFFLGVKFLKFDVMDILLGTPRYCRVCHADTDPWKKALVQFGDVSLGFALVLSVHQLDVTSVRGDNSIRTTLGLHRLRDFAGFIA